MGPPGAGNSESQESPFKPNVLQGKVVLITGGGSGIGLEISRQFGRHGARLAIMGRREAVLRAAADELAKEGIEALPVMGDVRRKEDAHSAVAATVERYGRLDVLINGAAGNFLAAAEDLSVNGFRTVLDIDAVGTFNMCLAARPFLQRGARGRAEEEGGGSIINISATLHYTAAWYQVHVSAAKAAVDATTRSLALEWATDYGIRTNAIAPGPIGSTPGMAKLAPSELGIDAGELNPMQRMGDPWDIAMAALYLTADTGKYVNGATLVVDGGGWLRRALLRAYIALHILALFLFQLPLSQHWRPFEQWGQTLGLFRLDVREILDPRQLLHVLETALLLSAFALLSSHRSLATSHHSSRTRSSSRPPSSQAPRPHLHPTPGLYPQRSSQTSAWLGPSLPLLASEASQILYQVIEEEEEEGDDAAGEEEREEEEGGEGEWELEQQEEVVAKALAARVRGAGVGGVQWRGGAQARSGFENREQQRGEKGGNWRGERDVPLRQLGAGSASRGEELVGGGADAEEDDNGKGLRRQFTALSW
ncbi:unnamed protein product [Closterium sp. NIES-65]|nr:unnamed protein product [Closterium sp. NIES-65]